MNIIDLHCDTLLKLQARDSRGDLFENDFCSVDLRRLSIGDYAAQFFAMYVLPENECEADNIPRMSQTELVERMLETFYKNMEAYNEVVKPALNYDQMKQNAKDNKISAFLTIEDGVVVDDSFDKLKYYFDRGVRLITLTWNYENCFGFPNSDDRDIMQRGLKSFGKEAIQYMNELGMLIDVSHLSDGGFEDVLEISKLPVIASHSNARAICNHRRNLTDEMIKKLANTGGISGLNLCSLFLRDGENNMSYIVDMVRHLNHMKNIGGEEFVALGADYDGISNEVEIKGPDEMHLLFEELKKSGWSYDQLEKLKYRNAERIIKEVLK